MNKRINVYQKVPKVSSMSQSEYKRNQNGYGEPHCRDEWKMAYKNETIGRKF